MQDDYRKWNRYYRCPQANTLQLLSSYLSQYIATAAVVFELSQEPEDDPQKS